jgi:hypothetical protein
LARRPRQAQERVRDHRITVGTFASSSGRPRAGEPSIDVSRSAHRVTVGVRSLIDSDVEPAAFPGAASTISIAGELAISIRVEPSQPALAQRNRMIDRERTDQPDEAVDAAHDAPRPL